MKIAIAHDYLREYGGAERVLEALHDMFPEAPVYVAFYDKKSLGVHWQRFQKWDLRQTWMSKIPGIRFFYSPLRVLAPHAFASLDLSEYDVVISSANVYIAKAVKVKKGALHVCYCHTPPRSLYGYSTQTNWQGNPITKIIGQLINHYLRMVDLEVSRERVDVFVANSKETQKRIQKFYKRDSVIVYPPVAIAEGAPLNSGAQKEKGKEYYLYVNRLAFAKHPELAVSVCTKMNVPLKVVGVGGMMTHLRNIAGPTVEFLGAVDDVELRRLYAGAKALLYPVVDEDFGIVPVEAMSFGVPVIAHASGGPLETVVDGKTGVFFHELSERGLTEAIHLAQGVKWSEVAIKKHAKKFGMEAFREGISRIVYG
jgi:glycosyltransferase involved in cell wall biosynthesis